MALPKKQKSRSRRKVILPKGITKLSRMWIITRGVSHLKIDNMGNYDRSIFFYIKKKYLMSEKDDMVLPIKKKSKSSPVFGVLKPKALVVGILSKSRKSLPKPPMFLKRTPTNTRIFRKQNSKRSKYIKRLVTICKLRTLSFYYPIRTPALKGLWRKKIKKFGVGTVIRRPLSKFRLKLKPFMERPRRYKAQQRLDSPLLAYSRYTDTNNSM